jgi:hypothetical protein
VGHPETVETLVKVDEVRHGSSFPTPTHMPVPWSFAPLPPPSRRAYTQQSLLTGSSDGLIRLCGVHPNKLLGVLGSHDDFPVEAMQVGGGGAGTHKGSILMIRAVVFILVGRF